MKRYAYINDDDSFQELYRDNRTSNTKYSVLNFLPKNLWEQFSRFMNQYFLLIACLQLWPLITPVNPASTWANEREVWVVQNGIKKLIQAQNIRVGNIVWLRENDEVPCDLVLMGTSDAQGLCYVETSALDGETDLKTRVVPPACMGIDAELLQKIKTCYLRNTELGCGVAIYTGNETKLGMSRGVPEPKLTAVDAMIDKLTGLVTFGRILRPESNGV
ncbi:hypothetical protein MLD38_015955 [Melastoma candidum]|uniref:Uncharacterized protein n=1 Tax=Melastoma candidum TaxID=119954 RepID=A0ACB9RH38_9MYRT|nr:hypothetical protein MLD38_015955 [Melastoma candidum]